jgi:predicted metal-dependent RNase
MKYEKTLLFDPATVNFPRIEHLIIESTYGGSKDLQPSRRWAEKRLQGLVNEVTARGGKILIPTFAVGRSQEVMIVLENAMRNKSIEKLPIYLDGMIWEATAIHTAYPEYLNNNLRNMIFHDDLNPFLSDCFIRVDSTGKREEAMESGAGIILATSGMLNGGPILEYLRRLGPNDKNMLVFVGYQAEGTLGKRIQNGWREIPLPSDGRTDMVKLNLDVQTVDGFSGHSDRQQLMEYIKKLNQNPKQAFVTHGEESKCIDFANSINKRYKVDAIAPKNLETYRLL